MNNEEMKNPRCEECDFTANSDQFERSRGGKEKMKKFE